MSESKGITKSAEYPELDNDQEALQNQISSNHVDVPKTIENQTPLSIPMDGPSTVDKVIEVSEERSRINKSIIEETKRVKNRDKSRKKRKINKILEDEKVQNIAAFLSLNTDLRQKNKALIQELTRYGVNYHDPIIPKTNINQIPSELFERIPSQRISIYMSEEREMGSLIASSRSLLNGLSGSAIPSCWQTSYHDGLLQQAMENNLTRMKRKIQEQEAAASMLLRINEPPNISNMTPNLSQNPALVSRFASEAGGYLAIPSNISNASERNQEQQKLISSATGGARIVTNSTGINNINQSRQHTLGMHVVPQASSAVSNQHFQSNTPLLSTSLRKPDIRMVNSFNKHNPNLPALIPNTSGIWKNNQTLQRDILGMSQPPTIANTIPYLDFNNTFTTSDHNNEQQRQLLNAIARGGVICDNNKTA